MIASATDQSRIGKRSQRAKIVTTHVALAAAVPQEAVAVAIGRGF